MTAGTGGSAMCYPPIILCSGCNQSMLGPDCVNGEWRCPVVDCPKPPGTGGSAGTSGAGGELSIGGEAGASGDPLDELEPACWVFCRTREVACPDNPRDTTACYLDCLTGHAAAAAACSDEIATYLRCAGAPDECSDVATTPLRCASEETSYLACVLGPVPDRCLRSPPTASIDGCQLETFCGASGNYGITCDSENDRTGTSLCDCSVDGTFSDTYPVTGVGALACAQAAELCGPR